MIKKLYLSILILITVNCPSYCTQNIDLKISKNTVKLDTSIPTKVILHHTMKGIDVLKIIPITTDIRNILELHCLWRVNPYDTHPKKPSIQLDTHIVINKQQKKTHFKSKLNLLGAFTITCKVDTPPLLQYSLCKYAAESLKSS